MLHLDNITIGYGKDRTVARNLTAHLTAGTLTCLIGRNGTGKSTLLRTIAAFLPALGGTITIDLPPRQHDTCRHYEATDIAKMTPRQRAKAIGVVLTERAAPDNMTAREMVAMGRMPYTGFWGRLSRHDQRIVDKALDMTGTAGMADSEVCSLSDGERQKVMIAKALAQQTPLIILDEPTAFLDYPSKISTMNMLRRLCHEEGKTVLLSTHDLDAAMRMTDNVWLMENGTLLTGTPAELQEAVGSLMGGA